MIKKYITKIKSKPEHQRKQITYGLSAVITAMIGIVWLGSGFATPKTQVIAESKTQTSSNATNPFSVIRSNLGSAYSAFMDSINGKVSATNESPTTEQTSGSATLEYVPQDSQIQDKI